MLKIGDYYHNYEKIGKGSYSTVYKGYHKNLYKEVAFISGEVRFPGFYNIDNSITSIKQLIDLAGDFTDLANEKLVMIEGKSNQQFDITNITNRPQEYLTESDVSWIDIGINHYINNRSIIIYSKIR